MAWVYPLSNMYYAPEHSIPDYRAECSSGKNFRVQPPVQFPGICEERNSRVDKSKHVGYTFGIIMCLSTKKISRAGLCR